MHNRNYAAEVNHIPNPSQHLYALVGNPPRSPPAERSVALSPPRRPMNFLRTIKHTWSRCYQCSKMSLVCLTSCSYVTRFCATCPWSHLGNRQVFPDGVCNEGSPQEACISAAALWVGVCRFVCIIRDEGGEVVLVDVSSLQLPRQVTSSDNEAPHVLNAALKHFCYPQLD